jgi:hypothetical protein
MSGLGLFIDLALLASFRFEVWVLGFCAGVFPQKTPRQIILPADHRRDHQVETVGSIGAATVYTPTN